MLEWGYAQDSLKVAIRIPTYSYEHADYPVDKDYSDLNRFKIIRKGEKVAVIGAGDYLKRGREVCDLLRDKGIDATLINPRFVSGVDKDMIESLKADHQLVATIEDGSVEGGFGERVASAVGPTGMRCLNFGLPKRFADHYRPQDLERENGLMPDQIAAEILKVVDEK